MKEELKWFDWLMFIFGTIFCWAGWTLIFSLNVFNIIIGIISIIFGLSPVIVKCSHRN